MGVDTILYYRKENEKNKRSRYSPMIFEPKVSPLGLIYTCRKRGIESMKRIYGIGIGIVCTILFSIYTWQEGTLSAYSVLTSEGVALFIYDEQGVHLQPYTLSMNLADMNDPYNRIENFDFEEISQKFQGNVISGNLNNLFTMNGNNIAAGEYGIRVVRVQGSMNEDPLPFGNISVVTYQKAVSDYTISLHQGEVISPDGYGTLSCSINDEASCSLKYEISDETIATVSSTGEITGIAEGSTSVLIKLKTEMRDIHLETIPVTVTSEQEPVIDFAYVALQPELKEGEIAAPTKIGTLSVTPADADISGYTFEIDGDAHLSIQNQEVLIATDTPANTYTYHVVVKKEGVEVFRSTPQTIQVQEPEPIPTPDPDQGTDPTPDPTPDPDQGTDPDPAPTITFSYNSIITSLEEGYSVQKIGEITPSIQGSYYYEVRDANPCVEVTQNGFVNILTNQSAGTHTFTIAMYTDDTKTNHLADIQDRITITQSQTPDPSPEEEPFQFEYQYSNQQPDSILQRIYDPQNNTFQISTNKENVNVQSLQEDILTINGSIATIHKACEEGVILEAVFQNQTYQLKVQIAKAEQQPVSFASNQIDIAYGTLSYDPVFSGGSGTGEYVLTSSDLSKIMVSSTSSSTLNIHEGATGEVRITLMRKGDENYRDSISTQMIVRLLEDDPIDPDPNPDQPSDNPNDHPDTPPVDDERKKTIPSSEIDGTITYEEGFSNEAVFRIEDITANSAQDSSITSLEVKPKLVLRLHLDHATLTAPAKIKIPISHVLGNLDTLRYFYENEEGILQEIHPTLHQNELEFSSKVMGKLVIAQDKEVEETKEPVPKPSDEKGEGIQPPSDESTNNKQPSSNTQNDNQSTVQDQGIQTGDTTRLIMLIIALCLSSIILIFWIRRNKRKE